jgi:ABC-type dipeptide/oligopeptide/nickel transport system ATPase subunit
MERKCYQLLVCAYLCQCNVFNTLYFYLAYGIYAYYSGKTTLIKMLLGKEQPDAGSIQIGDTVKIVSVGQERMDELNPEKTVYDEISEGRDELELGTMSVLSRAYLSWFGFKGGQQQSKVGKSTASSFVCR